jgi:hypothetical protein
VSPVKYKMCFYIQEDAILRSHRRENLKSYIACCLLDLTNEVRGVLLYSYLCCYLFVCWDGPNGLVKLCSCRLNFEMCWV